MICIHCLKDAVEYGPLGYCEQCKVWYEDEGEEIPIADTTMDNIRRADEICAACENKNFVIE